MTEIRKLAENDPRAADTPYLITKCEKLQAFYTAESRLRVQVTTFGPNFQSTAACKSTGRAQQHIQSEALWPENACA
eukprot:10137512-Lingulodinium_polyedra.AAC.1